VFPIEVLSLFPFDDAKVRRFPELAMDRNHFLHKNRISFDVNQVPVCEHRLIVHENSILNTPWLALINSIYIASPRSTY